MTRLLLLLIVAGVVYQFYQDKIEQTGVRPVKSLPYVVIYGRDSCGFTQRQRDSLRSAGIMYEFRSVDRNSVANGLHQRMDEQGLNIRRYDLPVVDVNGQLKVRPDVRWAEQEYKRDRG